MKKMLAVAIAVSAVLWSLPGWCLSPGPPSMKYQAVQLVELNASGKVLQAKPAKGTMILFNNGTYAFAIGQKEQGQYRFAPASPQQPQPMIYFQSTAQRKFVAFVHKGSLMVWMNKTARQTHVYLNMKLVAGPAGQQGQAPKPPASGGSPFGLAIKDGRFTAKVMYGDTSAPNYLMQDRTTGEQWANEKGIVLRPDGTFALRTEVGNSVVKGSGVYRISGNKVAMQFQDKSTITLTMEQGGKKLSWYGQGGMLISEFFFMGIAR